MKIGTVRAKLFHADGRTDITKLIVAFRNFATAPISGRQHERMKYRITAKKFTLFEVCMKIIQNVRKLF